MANYLDFHRDCPNCGSHDALTVFSDGGAKCFSCGWSWKDFYKTIGIKERKNDRCRMNFMPKKYWKYILEMSDENEKSN